MNPFYASPEIFMYKSLKFSLSFLMVLLFSTALQAARTDIVILKNGDRVTGDIKGLSRG